MRIVSHTCSNTEIICALGLARQLVGVDDHSDYPEEVVRGLPRIGPDLDIDVDKIRALRPDLVVTSLTVPGHERCLERLQQAGLPVLVTDPRTLDDVAADIQHIADALDVAARGRQLAQQFRTALDQAREAQQHNPHPAVPIAVEWWPKPVIVPGRDSWVTQMLPLAGAYNPWRDAASKSLTVEPAAVRQAAPQAVVMSWCGVDESKYRPHIVHRRDGWETIPAIRHGHIYPISEAYLGRPGPRLLEGLQRLRAVVGRVTKRK